MLEISALQPNLTTASSKMFGHQNFGQKGRKPSLPRHWRVCLRSAGCNGECESELVSVICNICEFSGVTVRWSSISTSEIYIHLWGWYSFVLWGWGCCGALEGTFIVVVQKWWLILRNSVYIFRYNFHVFGFECFGNNTLFVAFFWESCVWMCVT